MSSESVIRFFIFTLLSVLPASLGDIPEVTLSYRVQEEGLGSLVSSLPRDLGVSNSGRMSFAILDIIPDSLRAQVKFQGVELIALEPIDREKLCDREPTCGFVLNAIALDSDRLTHKLTINVSLLDINDNTPTFNELSPFNILLPENAEVGYSVELPTAVDADLPPYGVKLYRIKPTQGQSFHGVQVVESGREGGDKFPRLTVVQPLSQLTHTSFTLTLQAVDGGDPVRIGELELSIQVKDPNIHAPVFVQSTLSFSVAEDTPVGTIFGRILARDYDHGVGGNVTYSFGNNRVISEDDIFVMGRFSGEIELRHSLDYESQTSHTFRVLARDRGAPPRTVEGNLHIAVEDVNDCAPVISFTSHLLANTSRAVSTDGRRAALYVKENVTKNAFLGFIEVTDQDSGNNGLVECAVTSEFPIFELTSPQKHNYQMALNAQLDYEVRTAYELTIGCSDKGQTPELSELKITLFVVDMNDHSPVFKQKSYSITLAENDSSKFAVVGVAAVDRDHGVNSDIRYSIEDKATGYLEIHPERGIIETTGYPFDHEKYPSFEFQVFAKDGGTPQRTGTATVSITITDENDEAAEFVRSHFSLYVAENEAAGAEAGFVTAVDKDDPPYNEFVYDMPLTSDEMMSFKLDSNTGRLTATRSLDREIKDKYHLRILTKNLQAPYHERSVEVFVYVNDTNDNDPVVFFPQKPNATVQVHPQNFRHAMVTQIQASDLDNGKNAALEYFLTRKGDSHKFSIDRQTGVVVVTDQMEAKVGDTFYVQVAVRDGGHPTREVLTSIIVKVSDRIPIAVDPHVEEDGPESLQGGFSLTWFQTLILIIACVSLAALLIVVLICLLVRRKRSNLTSRKSVSSVRCNGEFKTFSLVTPSEMSENTMSWQRKFGNQAPPAYRSLPLPSPPRKTTGTVTDNFSVNSELSGAEDELPELPSGRRTSRTTGPRRTRPRYDSRSSQTSDDLQWLYQNRRDSTLDYLWNSNESVPDAPEQPMAQSDALAVQRMPNPRLRTLSGGDYGRSVYPRSPMAMIGPNYVHFFGGNQPDIEEELERTESQVSFESFKPKGNRANLYASVKRYKEAKEKQEPNIAATATDDDDDDVFAPNPSSISRLSEVSEENCASASFEAMTPVPTLNEESLKFVRLMTAKQWNAGCDDLDLEPPPCLKNRLNQSGDIGRVLDEERMPLTEANDDSEQIRTRHKHTDVQNTGETTEELDNADNVRRSCTPDLLEHAQGVIHESTDSSSIGSKECAMDEPPTSSSISRTNSQKGKGKAKEPVFTNSSKEEQV